MAQATNRADKVQPCMQIRENELEVSVTSGNIFFFWPHPQPEGERISVLPQFEKKVPASQSA